MTKGMRPVIGGGPDSPSQGGFSLLEVLVALMLTALAVGMLMQLLAGTLKTSRKASDYTMGLAHARSLLDYAYTVPKPSDIPSTPELDGGFSARRDIKLISEEEGVSLYEITVTVSWAPAGAATIRGVRAFYDDAGR